MGERLTVQFARGTRNRDTFANTERTAPRPRRTPHRMQISGLPGETSWQVCFPVPSSGLLDLKSCYLDAEQHNIGPPLLYSDRSSAQCLFSPGQHHALPRTTVPLQCASAFA